MSLFAVNAILYIIKWVFLFLFHKVVSLNWTLFQTLFRKKIYKNSTPFINFTTRNKTWISFQIRRKYWNETKYLGYRIWISTTAICYENQCFSFIMRKRLPVQKDSKDIQLCGSRRFWYTLSGLIFAWQNNSRD